MAASDDVSVGVPDIDGEHTLQIQLLRSVERAVKDGATGRALLALGHLEDFTNAHFLSEQLLMRLHAYPGFEAHVAEHDRLIGELGEMRRALETGTAAPAATLAAEVERWLLVHIRTADRALGSFLAAGPASA